MTAMSCIIIITIENKIWMVRVREAAARRIDVAHKNMHTTLITTSNMTMLSNVTPRNR